MANKQSLLDLKTAVIKKYSCFASQIASTDFYFDSNTPFHTAATDGNNIIFDSEFFSRLSEDERMFVVAHELMHIKFQHMYRLTNPDGSIKNLRVWNIATDAIINANLERDGLKILNGAINMPEAINYTAEEFYEKLLQEMQEKEDSDDGSSTGNGEASKTDNSDVIFQDDHSLWEKAFEEQTSQETNDTSSTDDQRIKDNRKDKSYKYSEAKISKGNTYKDIDTPITEYEATFDEKAEFARNRQEKQERAMRNLNKLKNQEFFNADNKPTFSSIGKENAIIDWKVLLRREVDKNNSIWSQRRSVAENNFAYRLLDYDDDSKAESEVLIDVSGSVGEELVKSFLRQLKNILISSTLKVGFFADGVTRNADFIKITKEQDIDNLTIKRPGNGTNFDVAVREFSKNPATNKIIFTDGWPGQMPLEDTKKINVIWLVYENKNFKPCCGKVIQVSPKQIKSTQFMQEEQKTIGFN